MEEAEIRRVCVCVSVSVCLCVCLCEEHVGPYRPFQGMSLTLNEMESHWKILNTHWVGPNLLKFHSGCCVEQSLYGDESRS